MSANLNRNNSRAEESYCSSGNHTAALRLNTCVLDGGALPDEDINPRHCFHSGRCPARPGCHIAGPRDSGHSEWRFEAGFASWTRVDQLGSEGTSLASLEP